MAYVPPRNPFLEESHMRERLAEGKAIPKFSRKSALVGIAIVLILTIAGVVLLYTLH